MDYKRLNNDIKNKDFKSIYFFSGDEEFLKDFYQKELTKNIVSDDTKFFNLSIFEGNKISVSEIRSAVYSYPFMAEKKLVIIKNSGVFSKGSKELSGFFEEVLSNMPEYLHIIFRENEFDKRLKLYKIIDQKKCEYSLTMIKGEDLKGWVNKHFFAKGKKISAQNISYLISKCDASMYSIMREIEKLSSFLGERAEIEKKHIDEIVTKSVDSRIFDLVDCIIKKDRQTAFEIIRDLKILKEPIAKVAFIIYKHFTGLFYSKLMIEKGKTVKELSKELSTYEFVVSKYLTQAKLISHNNLKKYIKKCSEIDVFMKTGVILDGYLALYELVMLD